MCQTSIFSRLTFAALAVGLLAIFARPAAATELRLGRAPILAPAETTQLQGPNLSVFSTSTMTIGYLTPAYGALGLGVSPLSPRLLGGMNNGVGFARSFDVGGSYTTPVSVGTVGVYGAYGERPSILALTPSTSWTFGTSVGYAGFYVRGGVSGASAIGPLLGFQGLQAGVGYGTGDIDLRLTYLTSQGVGAAEREIDSKQWAIGGIYNITAHIRLNADAFYGVGENRGSALMVLPAQAAPPGTGARVGVQLRF